MSSSRATLPACAADGAPFAHEAFLYSGERDFLEGTLAFIEEGLATGEPTLVVLGAAKIDALRHALGPLAAGVQFADMAAVGANPARIIPAWRDFVDRRGASEPCRGIGEPIWAERGPAELVECQRHEALLNVAFAGTRSFRLLCPYDLDALSTDVLEEAHRSHPLLHGRGEVQASEAYAEEDLPSRPYCLPLAAPVGPVERLAFGRAGGLGGVRRLAGDQLAGAGFPTARIPDIVVAINELASNSVRHGGGAGELACWREGRTLLFEVTDKGCIADRLADRRRPRADQERGYGLWLVNQVCDLVQIRSGPEGSVVRVHVHPEAGDRP
jgi:anti-sigma regulatory factor (Ser/Thr protein kinase)